MVHYQATPQTMGAEGGRTETSKQRPHAVADRTAASRCAYQLHTCRLPYAHSLGFCARFFR